MLFACAQALMLKSVEAAVADPVRRQLAYEDWTESSRG